MKFEITIIFVTLVILVTTLLLNSALSLASFEKIYVRSLVSTYELTGKNLKRKIEPSLRFGKPLENFKGMERFLAEVMENTPGLSYAGIVSPAGKILHHTDKSKAGELLALPVFDEKEQVHSSLVKGSYLTFLPLYNRAKKTVGFIYLSFSRDVIYQKLKLMAAESLNVLWLLLLSTSLGLILLLAVWIVQPIRRELTGICEVLKHAPEVLPANGEVPKPFNRQQSIYYPDESSMIIPEIQDYLRESKNNVKRMRWHIHTFVKQSFAGLSVVEKFQQEQYKLLTSCEDLERIEIEIQQFYGDGEKNRQEMEKLTELLREARNVRETLQDLLADSKTQCTNQD